MILRNFISEIEEHTGQKFEINSRRHYMLLNDKIERELSYLSTKLELIQKVILNTDNCDSLYNSKKVRILLNHYKQKDS